MNRRCYELPVSVGHLLITPVVEVRQQTIVNRLGAWSYAAKEPVALIIDSPSGRQTISLAQPGPLTRHRWISPFCRP